MTRTLQLTAVAAVAAVVVGCASAPSGDAQPVRPDAKLTPPGPRVTPPGQPAVGPVSQTPNAPQDAKYTIVCIGFTGENHVQQAKTSKDNLVKATGKRDFYVVHDESQSTIYYGYYKERERNVDPAEAARANTDLEYLRSLSDGENHRLFGASLIVPLPTPEVVASPEFDLTKLDQDKSPDDPNRRFWTIAIADYSNDIRTPDGKGRKQIVVEAVQEARKMGVEAYYYNGPNSSTVCIGAWPRRAVREQETDRAETAADTGQELVVSSSPLSKGMMDDIEKSGRGMKVVQPRVIVDDPDMLRVWQQYKEYSLNGRVEMVPATDPKTGEKVRRPKDTFLVIIPRPKADNGLLAGNRQPDALPDAGVVRNPMDPTAGQSSGIGALRPQSR